MPQCVRPKLWSARIATACSCALARDSRIKDWFIDLYIYLVYCFHSYRGYSRHRSWKFWINFSQLRFFNVNFKTRYMSILAFSLNQSVAATAELGIQPGTICLTVEHHNHRVPTAGQEIYNWGVLKHQNLTWVARGCIINSSASNMITYDWNLGTQAFTTIDLMGWCNGRWLLSPKAYDEQQETLSTAALVTRTETEPFTKATQMLNAQRKNAIHSTSRSSSTTLPYLTYGVMGATQTVNSRTNVFSLKM